MDSYLSTANGWLLGVLCTIVIAFVFVQAIIFVRKAWRRGVEIGMETKDMKKVVANSATFSILPSLPILVFLLLLMPTLGKYFPWLRLSVIGSGGYENLVANMTAQFFGLENVADAGMNMTIFLGILWTMTLGILFEPILTLFGSKFIHKGLGTLKGKSQKMLTVVMICLMSSLFMIFGAPYITSFRNVPTIGLAALTPLVAMVFAAVSTLLFNQLAIVTKKNILKEFSFPLSLVVGMFAAIVFSGIIS